MLNIFGMPSQDKNSIVKIGNITLFLIKFNEFFHHLLRYDSLIFFVTGHKFKKFSEHGGNTDSNTCFKIFHIFLVCWLIRPKKHIRPLDWRMYFFFLVAFFSVSFQKNCELQICRNLTNCPDPKTENYQRFVGVFIHFYSFLLFHCNFY